MRRILVANIFKNESGLVDFLSRFCHHFKFHKNLSLLLLRHPSFDPKKVDFSLNVESLVPPDISHVLRSNKFELVFKEVRDVSQAISELGGCTCCLIYDENFYKKNHASLKKLTAKFYYCDPVLTRQEGSNFIQASLDLLPQKDKLSNEANSLSKFLRLKKNISDLCFDKATIFATGPSVADFQNYEYSKSLNIYCNSTILDSRLLETAPPSILTFADPIFHFGVSEYANLFRTSCAEFLAKYEQCNILIPIKYYALALSLFPAYQDRIIGIPFTKHKPINFEITEENFYTYTTSNILTLLLLPVATTLAKSVRLIGCDGREVSDDSYFWSHGSSVQINDKMKAIQKAHPGFFNIDYNEYYFEHCHNLSRMLLLAEDMGWNFSHLGPSFIPALKSRQFLSSKHTANTSKSEKREAFVIIEPDGLEEGDGHYQIWHQSLEKVVKASRMQPYIFCNKSSRLYEASNAFPVFSTHSWDINMVNYKSIETMMKTSSFQIFYSELRSAINLTLEANSFDTINLYMYYGSIHHLQSFIKLKKELEESHSIQVNINCTLSFEAIRFSPNREKFWGDKFGHFKSILFESQYYFPSIKVFAMTNRFSQYIFQNYDILLPVLTHPILIEEHLSSTKQISESSVFEEKHQPKILFIGRYTRGKFPENYFDLIDQVLKNSNVHVDMRHSIAHLDVLNTLSRKYKNRLTLLADEMTEEHFVAAFRASDIVIIPYLPTNFLMRTSGILTDAVMNERPVVCFGHSSISDIVSDWKIGLYCNTFNSDLLLSAINLIYANYSLYKNAVIKYKNYLIKNATFAQQFNSCSGSKVKLLNVK